MGRLLCVALAAIGVIGCGDSGPKLVPVSGTITLDNEPMAADILFTPDPSNAAITSGGDTSGKAGNYKAMYAQRSGLAPGKYTVTVTEKTADAASSSEDRPMEEDPGMIASMEAARVGATTKLPKPAKAKKAPATQTFEMEVEPGGGVYDFDVKSDPEG